MRNRFWKGRERAEEEEGRQEADGPLPPAEAPTTSFPWFTTSIVLLKSRLWR